MRLLIVGMSTSIHTARWINQLIDQDWDIHLFPSIDLGLVHPQLSNISIHHSLYGLQRNGFSTVKCTGIPVISRWVARTGRNMLERCFPSYRAMQLSRLIARLNPDIVHSMETQSAGYLTAAARERCSKSFPPWIHTVWGSDIYLFGRLAAHRNRIRQVMEHCDYFICEGKRDIELARSFGFTGEILAVSPATGGFDLARCFQLRQNCKVSERRIIMLKGYQTCPGRALVGLRALERCAEVLKGYEVVIYSASGDVIVTAELLHAGTGIPITIIPHGTPHEEMLKLHGKARISLGLSISDGVPNSMLESMVMGSFPIQSWTACADEWIEDGKNGILVPPEDPDVVERAIRRALSDDDLVNQAAELNFHIAEKGLNRSVLKPMAVALYSRVMGKHSCGCKD